MFPLSRNFKITAALVGLITCLSGCFKQEMPVIGLPDDIKGDSLIQPPETMLSQKKVLIIGLNGCMGSAIRVARPFHIDSLLRHAVYSYDAVSDAPALNAPGWASMFTGVWPDKHGVTDNTSQPGNLEQFPSVFSYVRAFNPKAKIASVSTTADLNTLIAKNADIQLTFPGQDQRAVDSASSLVKTAGPDLVFLYLSGIEAAGRQFGFDTTAAGYLSAIQKADAAMGKVLTAVAQRAAGAKEDWLIVLCSDFGAEATPGMPALSAEKNIFVAFSYLQFQSLQVIPPATDLKAVRLEDIGQYGQIRDAFYNFDSMPEFTVEFKMRASELNNGNMPALVTNKDWNSGGNPGWVIYANRNVLGVNMGDGKGNRIDFENSTAPAVDDNRWHHICLTVDRKGDAKLYQDGLLYNSTSIIRIKTLMNNAAPKLVIDDDITGTFGSRYGNAKFNIGDLRIWNTALDDQAVLFYATSCDSTIGQTDPDYDHLLSWWKGTDGTGDALKDVKGKYDIQLTGQPRWEHQLFTLCNDPLPPSVPTLVDIVPSVLDWLNIHEDSGWQLDGRSWLP